MSQVISTNQSRFKRYWEEQAIQCAAHQRWAEAEKINRSIVKLCPEDVDARNRLGKALWELGLLEEAENSYRRALELDPGNAIAGRNLERLDKSLKTANETGNPDEAPRIPADIFIAESGKTTIVKLLPLPGRASNELPLPGDPVRLLQHGSIVRVLNAGGRPLGQLGAALSRRMSYLIDAGNRYAAAVVGIQGADIFIVIKETYQHASLVGQHSFPSQSRTQTGRFAYVRHSAASAAGSEPQDNFGDVEDWADLESEAVGKEDLILLEDPL
jgi:tetratricopeptide (TPR) repeat protein